MQNPFIALSPFGQNTVKSLMLSQVQKLHKFYDVYYRRPSPLCKFSLVFVIVIAVPVFCCQGSYILKHVFQSQETFRKTKVTCPLHVLRHTFALIVYAHVWRRGCWEKTTLSPFPCCISLPHLVNAQPSRATEELGMWAMPGQDL